MKYASVLGGLFLWLLTLAAIAQTAPTQGPTARVDDQTPGAAPTGDTTAQSKHAAAINTAKNLFVARDEKRDMVDALRKRLRESANPTEQAELEEQLKAAQTALKDAELKLESLATGISIRAFEGADQEFDLEREVERLFQPLVMMLKAATADAREIEELKQSSLAADQRLSMAEQALRNLRSLAAAAEESDISPQVSAMIAQWHARRQAAEDAKVAIVHQLDTKLASQREKQGRTGAAFTAFFRERGLNFLLGISSFVVVFVAVRIAQRAFNAVHHFRRRERRPAFYERAMNLGLRLLAFLLAALAMLVVFNSFNDWLLLGISLLFFLAIGWMIVKLLPEFLDQAVLLLDLGSVREGE
ncbi:MAG: hypothetical protein AAF493_26185 [Pseudomonadota bacterium]